MTDAERQADELQALASIYDESTISVSTEGADIGGQYFAHIHFPDTEKIIVKNVIRDNEGKKEFLLKYLPPLTLNFQLPENYPSLCPPNFTLSCKWLCTKQLSKLCRKLDEIWKENEGSEVLFLWTNFLVEETFDVLNLSFPLDFVLSEKKEQDIDSLDNDERAVQDIQSLDLLIPALLEYNKQESIHQFEITMHKCKVCLEDKFGSVCLRFLDCGHVYCKSCMKDYFLVQINDGNVMALECPDDKCESQAHPSQVKELVPDELFAKYDKMLLQTSLDKMLDVVYCPRPACQCPVMKDADSTMCSCPNCLFVFCGLCKFAYHGLSPCRIKSDNLRKLRDEYLQGDAATRRRLEKSYGQKAIQKALEESFSDEWLKKFSSQCPGCGTHIQKIDGCNKMTCMKCRTHFCWLCKKTLSRNDPYQHFRDKKNECFERLFEGITLEDEDDDEDFIVFM